MSLFSKKELPSGSSLKPLSMLERSQAARARKAAWGEEKELKDQNGAVKSALNAKLLSAVSTGDLSAVRSAILEGAPLNGNWSNSGESAESAYLAACKAPTHGPEMIRFFNSLHCYWELTRALAPSERKEPLKLALDAGQIETAHAIAQIAIDRRDASQKNDSFSSYALELEFQQPKHPGLFPAAALGWLAQAASRAALSDQSASASDSLPGDAQHQAFLTRPASIDFFLNQFSDFSAQDLRQWLPSNLLDIAKPCPQVYQRLISMGAAPVAQIPQAAQAITQPLSSELDPSAEIESSAPLSIKRRVLASRSETRSSPGAAPTAP